MQFQYYNLESFSPWATYFFISNTFISNARQKIKQMLRNTMRLNFCYLKIIHILHSRYHPRIMGHIPKNKQKNKCVCIHEIIRLIIMKMKIKMKNRSHRYNINRPKSKHGYKYSEHKKYLRMIMLTYIKQHLSNISSSLHEKVKQHCGWIEKNRWL